MKMTFDAQNSRCVSESGKSIQLSKAICIAAYAADEHPYDKDPARPETFSDYSQGWEDACLCIKERLEALEGGAHD